VLDHPHRGVLRAQLEGDPQGAVAAAVVDDDHLVVDRRPAAGEDRRVHRRGHVLLLVEAGEDDRHAR
jgi:hypothetical protein